MFVERLQLKNFGKHTHIDFHISTALVGVLGENFSGKTTVIAGLKWLLTNTLDDENVSYIRNYDPDIKGQKAEGMCVLRHKGRRIKIERSISGKSQAKLTILSDPDPEASVITMTSKVDAWLAGFLGLGKQSAARTTFIAQGELTKLLSGTSGERYATMAKIMDVAFVDTAEKIVAKQIETMNKLLVDYAPALLLASDQEKAAQAAAEAADELYARADMSYEGRLPKHRQLVSLRERKQDAEASLRRAEASCATLDAELEADPLKNNADEVRRNRDDKARALVNVQAAITDIERLARLRHQQALAEEELGRARPTLLGLALAVKPAPLRAEEARLTQEVQRLQEEEAQAAFRVRREREYEAAVVAHKEAMDRLTGSGLGDQASAQSALDAAAKTLSETGMLVRLLSSFTCPTVSCECPLCRSTTPPSPEDVQLRLKEAKEREARETIDHRACVMRVHNLAALAKAAENAAGALASCKSALDSTPQTRALELISAELLAVKNKRLDVASRAGEAEKKAMEFASMQKHVAQIEQKIAWIKNDLAGINITADQEALRLQSLTLTREIGEDDVRLAAHDRLMSRAANRSGLVTLREDYDKLHLEEQALMTDLGYSRGVDSDVISAEINRLEILRQHVTELVAKRNAAYDQLKARQADVLEVKRKMEASAKDRRRLEKLREFKDSIGKNGATGAYLKDVFQKVLVATQRYLVMMNSPMAVFADDKDPFEIVFRDLTNETTRPLSQNKMSGAQKVRVSLAFLLALHERVVPEIGFLCLDEPSCHLSAETGIADLRELLAQLGDRMTNIDGQIWTIDHAPALQTVLGSTLRL